jgi:hypothetical protein
MLNILTSPLGPAQIRRLLRSTGRVSVVVPVDLDMLISQDLEGLNDLVTEQILGLDAYTMDDIAYSVVGSCPPTGNEGGGTVLLRVDADIVAL